MEMSAVASGNNHSISSLSSKEVVFVAGEYLGAFVVLATVISLFVLKKMNKQLFILFWVGFALACIWEFSHEVLGAKILTKGKALSTIPGPIYALLHSTFDALLFLGGTGICYGLAYAMSNKQQPTQPQIHETLGQFSIVLFLAIFVYGVGQEIVVEALFNNSSWKYTVGKYNPVIIRPNVTLVPVMEWVIAIILYYIVQTVVYYYITP